MLAALPRLVVVLGVAAASASLPQAAGAPLRPTLTPRLTLVDTIVAAPDGVSLRDPSWPLWSAEDGHWHFWASHIVEGTSGYEGTVWHYFARGLEGPWNTSGVAVAPSGVAGDFDAHATFTPAAFFDAAEGRWWLWYGGVASDAGAHREAMGMASAASPFGPFRKHPLNPVVTADNVSWCADGGGPARVDHAEPYIIGGERRLLVKGVCANFTALPAVYRPNDPTSFAPPYHADAAFDPLLNALNTTGRRGFEHALIFPGPDGVLHMTGHDHGDGRQPHYTSPLGDGLHWRLVNFQSNYSEPTPVWPRSGGPPGDQGGVPEQMIAFSGKPLHIDLLNVTWAP